MSQKADTAIFSGIDRVSVRDVTLNRLKKYIFSNAISSGQRLPSERELAELLGIGRPSVREALKVLETIGLVESRIGEGTFVTRQSGASIGRQIGVSLARWGNTVVEICDARQIIEAECAYIAAKRAEEGEIQSLAAILEQIENAKTSTDYLVADMLFHRQVSQATHNPIVIHIVDNLILLLEEALHEGQANLLPILEEGSSKHRTIFLMIAHRDPSSAAEAMREHIQFSTELWKALVSLGTPTQEGQDIP